MNKSEAFTLIEVLVALTLLSVAVVPLTTSYVVSWRSSQDAHRRSRAVMLSQWKMAELRAEDGYEVTSQSRSECELKPPYDETGSDMFDCTVAVESSDEFNDTKRVTVTILYDSPFGGESSVDITMSFSCHTPRSC
ncbi:MAG: prepilin-type N-terminal cleavage/methylation domain-containing protein [bacterium]